MIKNIAKEICVFLLILDILQAVTTFDHYPDDDYVVEHEVSYYKAIALAKNLTIPTGKLFEKKIYFKYFGENNFFLRLYLLSLLLSPYL